MATSREQKTRRAQVVVVMVHHTAAANEEKYRMMKITVQAGVGVRPSLITEKYILVS